MCKLLHIWYAVCSLFKINQNFKTLLGRGRIDFSVIFRFEFGDIGSIVLRWCICFLDETFLIFLYSAYICDFAKDGLAKFEIKAKPQMMRAASRGKEKLGRKNYKIDKWQNKSSFLKKCKLVN